MKVRHPKFFALAADFIRWKAEQFAVDSPTTEFLVEMKWGRGRQSLWTGEYHPVFETAKARITKYYQEWLMRTKITFPYTLRRHYRGHDQLTLIMEDLQDVMVYVAAHEVAHHLQWKRLLGERPPLSSKAFGRMREPQADMVAFDWTKAFQQERKMNEIFANEARVRIRDWEKTRIEDDIEIQAEEEEVMRKLIEWRKEEEPE